MELAYITYDKYRELDSTIPSTVAQETVERYILFASLKVRRLTFGRIHSMAELTEYQRTLVELAVAIQTAYVYSDFMARGSGFGAGVASWSITDISISYNTDAQSELSRYLEELTFSSVAYGLLELTGLTWRGVR